MIQTKQPIVYGARNEKTGIIKIEVRPETPVKDGCDYLVIDWDTSNDKDAYFSKRVFYTNERMDQLDTYIEANYQDLLTGLGKADRERKKIQIALMIDTQTNLLPSGKTIYGLNPDGWEFTPDVIPPVLPGDEITNPEP